MKKLLLLLSAFISIAITANAQGAFQFKAQFIKNELAPAKEITILTNDEDENMDSTNA